MRHCLQPYPAYQPSGVPWISDVPAHWEVTLLGRIGTFSKGRGGTKDHEVSVGLPCIRYGDIYVNYSYMVNKACSYISAEHSVGYTRLQYEDILFAGSGETIEEIGKSVVNLIEGETYCGADVIIFRPTVPLSARFMAYALGSLPAIKQKSCMGRGTTIMHIYSSQLKYLWLALPPPIEQEAVALYLDQVSDRINRYISAKERLITLLEEQRQAVVHQAVIRGLNPDVPLKPSGIPWIGDIPKHWTVGRLGFLVTKLGSGVTPRGGATIYSQTGIPFLRSQNVHFDGLRLEAVARISLEIHNSLAGTHVSPGDVLLNITGASIGRVCAVPDDFAKGNVNQHVCIIRPKQSYLFPLILASYLSTNMMQREIRSEQSGASREGLKLQSIRNFPVVIPPLSEQTAIVQYLQQALSDIITSTVNCHRQIKLMNEYRTRLTADVVTGQLDVREAATDLLAELL